MMSDNGIIAFGQARGPLSFGQARGPVLTLTRYKRHRRDNPLWHLYQLIRFSGHLDVPIPVQKAS